MRMKARYIVLGFGFFLLFCLFFIMSGRERAGEENLLLNANVRHNNNRLKFDNNRDEDEEKTSNDDMAPLGNKDKNGLHPNVVLPNSEHKKVSNHKSGALSKLTLSELAQGKQKVERSCLPKENVTFIKAHKTGSSTVQNIFLRYGDKHNLKFVLPPRGHHLGYPNFFQKKHMISTADRVYNIFCHHARFSQTIPQIMPPNTIYITIVRDPVKVFESAFIYFKMDYRLGMTNDPEALQKFLKTPETFYNSASNKVHMKNSMLYDMGVAIEDFSSEELLKKHIKTFHKRYRLVMVAEYFEESLILLRDLLCWSTEDVVVFKLNTRKDDSIVSLSEKTKQDIREWNNGDVLLYEHFNRTIQKTINDYGRSRMEREVALLRQKTQELYERCIQTDHANKEDGHFKVWQPFGVHINAFVLKEDQKGNKLCESMIMPEIQFTQDLREKQFAGSKNQQLLVKKRKGRIPM